MKSLLLVTAVAFGLFCSNAGAQSYALAFTNPMNGTNSVAVAPGAFFTVTLTLSATAPSVAVDYFLQILNGGSSQFRITGRDLAGSTFNQPITADSIALQPGRALLNPLNDDDLGASLTNPGAPNGSGSFLIANLTLQALTGTAPGLYMLSTANATVGDAGFNDNAVGNTNYSVSVVPEPATYMLLGLGLMVCAQRFFSRKNAR